MISKGSSLALIDVVVGLIQDIRGRFLISQRRAGTHMEGCWEFPGGKRRQSEDRFRALVRELREELDIHVIRAEPFTRLTHCYDDRRVALDFWLVKEFSGIPRPNEGQALRWVLPEQLVETGLLDADRPVVDRIIASQRQH